MLHMQHELVLVNKAEAGVNHERAALVGVGGDEVKVGLLSESRFGIGNDQVIGMWCIHGFGVMCFFVSRRLDPATPI